MLTAVEAPSPPLHGCACGANLVELVGQALVAGGAQQGVQGRPALRVVDWLPAKQGLDVGIQSAGFDQVQQLGEHGGRHQVLGVVQPEPRRRQGEVTGPVWLCGKKLLYGGRFHAVRQRLKLAVAG